MRRRNFLNCRNLFLFEPKQWSNHIVTLERYQAGSENIKKIIGSRWKSQVVPWRKQRILAKNNFPSKQSRVSFAKCGTHQTETRTKVNISFNEKSPFLNGTTSPSENSTMVNTQPTLKRKEKGMLTIIYSMFIGTAVIVSKEIFTKSDNRSTPTGQSNVIVFRCETKLRPGQCSCVVYGIPCLNCPGIAVRQPDL